MEHPRPNTDPVQAALKAIVQMPGPAPDEPIGPGRLVAERMREIARTALQHLPTAGDLAADKPNSTADHRPTPYRGSLLRAQRNSPA